VTIIANVRKRFNTRAAAEILGVSPKTLRNWRWQGIKGPRFVMDHGRAYYYEDELAAYESSHQEQSSTMEVR
jgi:hypothetical protein